MNENIIDRVARMEQIFDALKAALDDAATCGDRGALCSPAASEMKNMLVHYYESGQWLRDFEADERGELPHGLKRGVLSEDGIYDLLCDIELI